MLSGKCFQACLPSHIQLCWNNQMLYHWHLARGWLTAANYCSICCPQQLLAWITPAGMEGHKFAGRSSGGNLIFRVFLGRQQLGQGLHILRSYHRSCCHHIWLSRWPEHAGSEPLWVSPVLLRALDQPMSYCMVRRKQLLIPSCPIPLRQTEASSVVLDISFSFPPSSLLQ